MAGERVRHTINFQGRQVLIVGLAREGMALARYLVRKGARVLANDARPRKSFSAQATGNDDLSALADSGVELALGGHPPSLLGDCEIVFVSPGVPFDSDFLNQARARGIPLSTETRLFCQSCPAPITAITGSSGKTTTTSLVAEMLGAAQRTTWIGGNIGQPLIERLDQIGPDDNVVMELSSFQLEYFHPSANSHVTEASGGRSGSVVSEWVALMSGWSPSVGAMLNVTPNHLDRHPSMDAYIHAKRAIVAYRRPGDVAVMGADNEVTRAIGESLPGCVCWFSRHTSLPCGAFLSGRGEEAHVLLRSGLWKKEQGRRDLPVCKVGDIRLPGEHNVSNVLAACAIAHTLDVPVEAMRHVATSFKGVEHRLELVAEVGGVQYYNDSIATSPERLSAALRSFDRPAVLLAGGRDKHLPWDNAACLMLQRTCHVILFGEATEQIANALEAARADPCSAGLDSHSPMIHRCVTLDDAVFLASRIAPPNCVVLLSPGCTSFDAFSDFAERGERFRALVEQIGRDRGTGPASYLN